MVSNMSEISFLIVGVTSAIRSPFLRRIGVPNLTISRIMSLATSLDRPIPQQPNEIRHRGALRRANVKTAGRYAGEEALVGGKTEQFSEAEARVEVIAGARGDFGFGREGALDQEAAVRPIRQRIGSRMDH